MSELVDRAITGLAALEGSAAFLEILRHWLQRGQEKRQEQLQINVRILEEGHALRQDYHGELINSGCGSCLPGIDGSTELS